MISVIELYVNIFRKDTKEPNCEDFQERKITQETTSHWSSWLWEEDPEFLHRKILPNIVQNTMQSQLNPIIMFNQTLDISFRLAICSLCGSKFW